MNRGQESLPVKVKVVLTVLMYDVRVDIDVVVVRRVVVVVLVTAG